MDEPRGKEYSGPSGVGRDSVWLTAEDLVEGKDATVEIEQVILYPEVKFQAGRTRLNLLGLKFIGKQRVLGLNATNRKSLNKQFGNIAKGWKGQTITLYVTETQMAGETVKCVRIRDQRSRAATAAEEFLNDPTENEPRAHGESDATEQDVVQGALMLGMNEAEVGELKHKHNGDLNAVYDELRARASADQ